MEKQERQVAGEGRAGSILGAETGEITKDGTFTKPVSCRIN